VAPKRRLAPYVLLAVLLLGTGLGIGLGLAGAPTTGQIQGTVNILSGGPAYRPYPGTAIVYLARQDRLIRTLSVPSERSFRFAVAPGKYRIAARNFPNSDDPCVRTRQANGLMRRTHNLVFTAAVDVGSRQTVRVYFSCVVNPEVG
jgi:hypothetical protein